MEETKNTVEVEKSKKEIILAFFKKHYKKMIAGVLALVILAVGGVLLFQYAAAPEIEDIYDRMVYLIETSQDVNALIYGCGVPVWEDDSEFVEFQHVYHGFENTAETYEIVMPNAKFLSIQQMKDELATIYSQAYLEDVVYNAIFDGYAISDNAGSSAVSVARYYEEDVYLWQSKEYKTHFTGIRVYDYSTMQVRSLGKTDRCVITIDTWLEDSPDQVENIEILIALQDGQWYLDNFVG